jgi:hypothetical protein
MKILALAIENLRKIKAATLDLKDGNLTQIRGPNRAGKSTILLAAQMLFGGKSIVPKDAITHGKEEARIIGIVNDYTIKVIIKKNGAHSLTVEKEGMKKTKPQAFLDALAGKFLDPQWFSQLPGTEKKRVLMKHLGLDFAEIDKEIAGLEDTRLMLGRRLKAIGEVKNLEKVDRVSYAELIAERDAIFDFNREQETQAGKIADAKAGLGILKEEKAVILAQIDDLQKKAGITDEMINAAQSIIDSLPPAEPLKSFEAIDKNIASAETTNAKALEYEMSQEKIKARNLIEAEYDEADAGIKAKRQRKEEALRDAEMPIDGLGITDDGLSLNGTADAAWSDSEHLLVAMRISAALSKELKIMFIKRGESLDRASLEEIQKFADFHDYQIIMEIVDDKFDQRDGNLIYIKEGEIIDGDGNIGEKETI